MARPQKENHCPNGVQMSWLPAAILVYCFKWVILIGNLMIIKWLIIIIYTHTHIYIYICNLEVFPIVSLFFSDKPTYWPTVVVGSSWSSALQLYQKLPSHEKVPWPPWPRPFSPADGGMDGHAPIGVDTLHTHNGESPWMVRLSCSFARGFCWTSRWAFCPEKARSTKPQSIWVSSSFFNIFKLQPHQRSTAKLRTIFWNRWYGEVA